MDTDDDGTIVRHHHNSDGSTSTVGSVSASQTDWHLIFSNCTLSSGAPQSARDALAAAQTLFS